MKPEKIQALKSLIDSTTYFVDRPQLAVDLLDLCDSALRLAAIEAAGPYSVTVFNKGQWEYESSCVTRNGSPVNDDEIVLLLNHNESVIADLRAKLWEAESLLRDFVRVGDLAAGKLSDHVGEMSRNFSQLSDLEVEQLGVAKRLLKFVSESEVQGG